MSDDMIARDGPWEGLDRNRRILWALLMRELSTRYGRDNLGFLWVVAEPILFAGSVSIMWSAIRTPYENGIPIVQFVITGYLPLILVRQTVNHCVSVVKVNAGLLYHRQITPLHLFIARYLVEFLGVSAAFVLIVAILNFLELMGTPKDLNLVLGGWFLLAWLSFGLATTMGALAEVFDFIERIVQIVTYIYIPFSGAFVMAANVSPNFRKILLALPFAHCDEMMRAGYFGEFIETYYDPGYVMIWASGLTLLGLFLVQFVRARVEVE